MRSPKLRRKDTSCRILPAVIRTLRQHHFASMQALSHMWQKTSSSNPALASTLWSVFLCFAIGLWSILPNLGHMPSTSSLAVETTQVISGLQQDHHGHSHGEALDSYWKLHGHDHEVVDHDHSPGLILTPGHAQITLVARSVPRLPGQSLTSNLHYLPERPPRA